MRDRQEMRRAIVAPAVESILEGAEMWERFADAAHDRGDLDDERGLRETAQRSRVRAAQLKSLAG